MRAVEFYKTITNDETAISFLQEKGIFPNSADLPPCSKCSGKVHLYNKSGRIVVRCRQRTCRSEYSIRKFNMFFTYKNRIGHCKSGLSLQAILEIVFCWINEMPIVAAAKTTGRSKATLCDWYNLCREVTAIEFNKRAKMGGLGKIVQIDECLLQGKRKSNKGRLRNADHRFEILNTDENDCNVYNIRRNYGIRLSGQWVVGIVEQLDDGTNEARFFIVDKRDQKTLHQLICQEVEPYTTVYSDCWSGYNGLSALGFNHYTVNHSDHFIDPISGANTQRIEAIWTRLRLKMVKQMKLSPLIDSHLIEHWYRLRYNKNLFESFFYHIRVNFMI